MRKIPLKNYILYVLLLVLTTLLVIFLKDMYMSKKDNSVLYNYLNSIKVDEFDELIMENPDLIIFVSNRHELTYSDKEEQLKKIIENNNLKDYSVFLDVENSYDRVYKILEEKYNYKIRQDKTPFIIIIDSQSIKDDIKFDDSNKLLLKAKEVFE